MNRKLSAEDNDALPNLAPLLRGRGERHVPSKEENEALRAYETGRAAIAPTSRASIPRNTPIRKLKALLKCRSSLE
jgi:hypothetical protein